MIDDEIKIKNIISREIRKEENKIWPFQENRYSKNNEK